MTRPPDFCPHLIATLYARHMPSCLFSLARIGAIAVFALAAPLSYAKQASTLSRPITPIVIEDIGKGTATLNGPCQFQVGDDPAWAGPGFDSSDWERIATDRPWGKQGHARQTGFAWYRCKIALTPALGIPPQFSLLMPKVDDAYEIYWNGSLIGSNGNFQPRVAWYFSRPAQIFELGKVHSGVLAVRVWKAPLLYNGVGEAGGFEAAPLIGSPEDIAAVKAAFDFQRLRGREFLYGENLLCALVALLSFLLWLRNPTRWLLFWLTCFALAPPLQFLLLNTQTRWPYVLVMGASQLRSAVRDVSLWFLLLWLLALHENRAVARFTRVLACICLANGALDGMLVAFSWKPQWVRLVQAADLVSIFFGTLLAAFPLILASYAILQRKQLDSTRCLVVVSAFLDEIIFTVRDAVKQGRGFGDWPIASSIDSPAFTILGSPVYLYTLSETFLLGALVYGVYISVRKDQLRQDTLEYARRDGQLASRWDATERGPD